MRIVLQRVASASVAWDAGRDHRRNSIGHGLVLLLGVGPDDDEAIASRLAAKVSALRIFADDRGRLDRSVVDVGGEALVVSQFTLYADLAGGRRPSFIGAASPAQAERLYHGFADSLRRLGVRTQTGSFGAHMDVELVNEGPVTLVVSSDRWPTAV